MPNPKHKRILLKLSGEAMMGDSGVTIDPPTLCGVVEQIKQLLSEGVEIAIVVGGGNIWRGAAAEAAGMDRSTADYAGMLGTLINALALQSALEKSGIATRTQSALTVEAVAEPYIPRRALRHLEKGRVVIFAGGTGNPYMTTDTAAALRAIEIGADVLLMAKHRVDGVYDADPQKSTNPRKFEKISYLDVLNLHLQVMDSTALSLCMEHQLPIIVFDLSAPQSIVRVVLGEPIGSIVST